MRLKKTYTTIEEFYKSIEGLITALRAGGKEIEANALNEIMHGAWTTSSELVGELMLVLKGMDADFSKDILVKKDACCYFAKHHRRILELK